MKGVEESQFNEANGEESGCSRKYSAMLREATKRLALLRLRCSVDIPLVLLVRDRRIGQASVSCWDVINPKTLVFLPGLAGLIQLFRRAADECGRAKRQNPNNNDGSLQGYSHILLHTHRCFGRTSVRISWLRQNHEFIEL